MVKRVEGQFFNKPKALHLDGIKEHEHKDADGHAHRNIGVCRGHYLLIFHASQHERVRNQIDGNQIHEVHEKDPHENGQSKRGNQRIFAVECVFNGSVDEFHHHFNEID